MRTLRPAGPAPPATGRRAAGDEGLGIYKNAINFRKVEEIGPNDIDSVILGTGQVEWPLTEFGERNKPKPAR
jgi:hypothetical protein